MAACTDDVADVAGCGSLSEFIYLGSTAIGSVTAELVFTDALAIGFALHEVSPRYRVAVRT